MATIDLTDATVTIGGVDLTGFASRVGFDLDPWQEQAMVRSFAVRPDFTMRFQGTVDAVSPGAYRALLGRTHPRLRRMHAAYGRRRGRGRW